MTLKTAGTKRVKRASPPLPVTVRWARVCSLMLLASTALGADALYYNGTILSLDAQARTYEAVGVRDGRIVAVGTTAAVSQRLRTGFVPRDLHGGTLLPGFYAAHDHFPDLGSARAARISPLASALQHHLRFTVHNDTPVTPVNPLLLVWTAVNRVTSSGKVLGQAEAIPVLQALRSVTSDAAWQNFEENERGSIEPGKFADFVLLDRNPLTVPAMDIRNLRVQETIIGGEAAWPR